MSEWNGFNESGTNRIYILAKIFIKREISA
jgi:hypothetical protein